MNSRFTVYIILFFVFFSSISRAQVLPSKDLVEVKSCYSEISKATLKFVFKDGDIPSPHSFQYNRLYLQSPKGDGNVDYIFSANSSADFNKPGAPVLIGDTLVFYNLDLDDYILWFGGSNGGEYYGGSTTKGTPIEKIEFKSITPDFGLPNETIKYEANGSDITYSLYSIEHPDSLANGNINPITGEVAWNDNILKSSDTVYAKRINDCGEEVIAKHRVDPLTLGMKTFYETNSGTISQNVFQFTWSDLYEFVFDGFEVKVGNQVLNSSDYTYRNNILKLEDDGVLKTESTGLVLDDRSIFDPFDVNGDLVIDSVWMESTISLGGRDYDLVTEKKELLAKDYAIALVKTQTNYCAGSDVMVSIDATKSVGLNSGTIKWYLDGYEQFAFEGEKNISVNNLISTIEVRVSLISNSGSDVSDLITIAPIVFPTDFVQTSDFTGGCSQKFKLIEAIDPSLDLTKYEVEFAYDEFFDSTYPNLEVSTSGNYAVRLKSKSSVQDCYSETKFINVSLDPKPDFPWKNSTLKVCEGGSVDLKDFIDFSKIRNTDEVKFFENDIEILNPILSNIIRNKSIEININFGQSCSISEKSAVSLFPLLNLEVSTSISTTCESDYDLSKAIISSDDILTDNTLSYYKLGEGAPLANPTVDASGEYVFELRNNTTSCVTRDTLDLTLNPKASINLVNAENVTCSTSGSIDVEISDRTAPLTYSWKDPQGNEIATSEDLSGLDESGTYTLDLTDGNSCDISFTHTLNGVNQGSLSFGSSVPNFAVSGETMKYEASSSDITDKVIYSLYSEQEVGVESNGIIDPSTGEVTWNAKIIDSFDTVYAKVNNNCGEEIIETHRVDPLTLGMKTFYETNSGTISQNVFQFTWSDLYEFVFDGFEVKVGSQVLNSSDYTYRNNILKLEDGGVLKTESTGLVIDEKNVFDSYDANQDSIIDGVWMESTINLGGRDYDLVTEKKELVAKDYAIALNKSQTSYCAGSDVRVNIDQANSAGLSSGTIKWYLDGEEEVGLESPDFVSLSNLSSDVLVRVELEINGTGGLVSDDVLIQVNTLPSLVVSESISINCESDYDLSKAIISSDDILTDNTLSYYKLGEGTPLANPTVDASGEYVFELRNNTTSCVTRDTLDLTLNPKASINLVNAENVTCSTSGSIDVEISDRTAPLTYSWKDPQGNEIATSEDLSGLDESGTYTLDLTDGNSCDISFTHTLNGVNQGSLSFGSSVPNFAVSGETMKYEASSSDITDKVIYSLYSEQEVGVENNGIIDPSTGEVTWNAKIIDSFDTVYAKVNNNCGEEIIETHRVDPLTLGMKTFYETNSGTISQNVFQFTWSDLYEFVFDGFELRLGNQVLASSEYTYRNNILKLEDGGVLKTESTGLVLDDRSIFDPFDVNGDLVIDSVWMQATITLGGVSYDLETEKKELLAKDYAIALNKSQTSYCAGSDVIVSIDAISSAGLGSGALTWYVDGKKQVGLEDVRNLNLTNPEPRSYNIKVELTLNHIPQILEDEMIIDIVANPSLDFVLDTIKNCSIVNLKDNIKSINLNYSYEFSKSLDFTNLIESTEVDNYSVLGISKVWVKANNAMCESTIDSFYVKINGNQPIPLNPVIQQPTCDNQFGSINVGSPSSDFVYQLLNSSNQTIPSSSSDLFFYQNLSQGKYTLSASSPDGCRVGTIFIDLIEKTDCVPICNLTFDNIIFKDVECSTPNTGEIKVVSASGGSGQYLYSLFEDTGEQINEIVPDKESRVFSGLDLGDYIIKVKDKNSPNCEVDSQLISLGTKAFIKGVELLSQTDSKCYGQPNGAASFKLSSDSTRFQHYIDVEGKRGWKSYRNKETLTNLPVGKYNIHFRVNALDLCPFTYEVNIGNRNSDDISLAWELIKQTDCDGNNGSFKVTSFEGGNGAPFEFKFMNSEFEELALDGTFRGLGRGEYPLLVKDREGCVKEFPIELGGSEVIEFDLEAVHPSCEGSDGVLKLVVNTSSTNFSGSYYASLTKNDEFIHKEIEITDGSKDFRGLDYGDYALSIKVADPTIACPNQKNAVLDKTGTKIKFELDVIQPKCKEDDARIILSNLGGENNNPIQLNLYDNEQTLVKHHSIEFTNAVDFLSEEINIGNSVSGEYKLKISQQQASSECLMKNQKDFTISRAPSKLSIGEAIHEEGKLPFRGRLGNVGSLDVKSIERSGVSPYSLELFVENVMWISNGDLVEEVTLDDKLPESNSEYLFENLYGGDYKLRLTDSFGCKIEESIFIPENSEIWIPNVFTPNKDGVNEEFYIRNMPLKSGSNWSMIIKNSSGLVVFKSDDYNETNLWDGGDLPSDVYYYNLDAGEYGAYSGWIKLIRQSR